MFLGNTHQLAFRTETLPLTTSHTLCHNSHLLLGILVPQAKCSLEFPLLCRIVPCHPEDNKNFFKNQDFRKHFHNNESVKIIVYPTTFLDRNNKQKLIFYTENIYNVCGVITFIMLTETKYDTLFIFMQVPKSASFKCPALSSNMLSGFTSLTRQKYSDIKHVCKAQTIHRAYNKKTRSDFACVCVYS